jgi:ornithine cyclodeaminase
MQARLQLEALALVRPIREARIWARDAAKAQRLAERTSPVSRLGFPCRGRRTARGGTRRRHHRHHHSGREADPDGGVAGAGPARHSDGLGRRAQERDRSGCFQDGGQSMSPTGSNRRASSANCTMPSRLGCNRGPDLRRTWRAVIAGKPEGRTGPQDITLADLTGTGVQDTASPISLLARAADAGCRTDNREFEREHGRCGVSVTLNFHARGICRALVQDPKAPWSEGYRAPDRHRSVQHALADRL